MDGIEVTPAAQKAAKAAAASSETTKTIKLAIAIGGLLIGGALIAWNLGVFGGSPEATPTPGISNPGGDAPAPRPVQPQRPTAIPATGAQQPLKP
jgi:hypothetical protein